MLIISQGKIIYSMLCQPVVGCLVQNVILRDTKFQSLWELNGLTLMMMLPDKHSKVI